MPTPPRQLHLNAFLMSTGHHEASWRLPESDPLASTRIGHYQNLARTAERGKLDSIFFADSPVLFGEVGRRPAGKLEPTVLLTAIAGATQKIGLIATASTTYNEPFNLARRFASVDWVSGGRAGWNVVTTAGPDAARNAWFSCVLALAWPDGEHAIYEGRIDGAITWPPRGNRGFGYDPVFVPNGYEQTFGEIDPEEKHRISHRAAAFAKLVAEQFGA